MTRSLSVCPKNGFGTLVCEIAYLDFLRRLGERDLFLDLDLDLLCDLDLDLFLDLDLDFLRGGDLERDRRRDLDDLLRFGGGVRDLE